MKYYKRTVNEIVSLIIGKWNIISNEWYQKVRECSCNINIVQEFDYLYNLYFWSFATISMVNKLSL